MRDIGETRWPAQGSQASVAGGGGLELKDGASEASARGPVLLLNSRGARTGVTWIGSESCQLDMLT